MRRRLGIENHFVKISTLMKDYSLPEKLEEEDVPMARMVEAEKLLNENEHYISHKDVATGHKFIIKKDYGIKRGLWRKLYYFMPKNMYQKSSNLGQKHYNLGH